MGRRRSNKGQPINGMLLLDKQQGVTSNAALQTAKRLLDAQKAGHTGSLDPVATGLLPLCFGHATKISGMFLNSDKRYDIEIKLGIATDSGDREGVITHRRSVDVETAVIHRALEKFYGEILQVPPMFSALKQNGQPLYKLARKGITVSREPRKVSVYDLRFAQRDDELLSLQIHCSKGFYVRSLAMDLGELLGCGAHVTALRRTAVGAFTIDKSITLEQLESLASLQIRRNLLIPADHALTHLPKVNLPENLAQYFCQGQAVRTLHALNGGMARLYVENNQFLGLGEITPEGTIAPKHVFMYNDI